MKEALKVLTNNSFLGAIFTTIILITLGFYLRRKNILKDESKEALTNIIMKLTLPALAFSAFMTDFNTSQISETLQVLAFSILCYIVLIFLTKLIFIRVKTENKTSARMIMIFGQVTLFSLPIIDAIYGSEAVLASNMTTIAFRLFLYSYAYFMISGEKIEKKHIWPSVKRILFNPIMILMLIGIVIWISQNIMPQVNIEGLSYSILRIDKTVPWLYKPIEFLYRASTPLAMLLIGVILGESNLKTAFKNKFAWGLGFLRSFVAPLVVMSLIIILQLLGVITFSKFSVAAVVLAFGAPVSVVINTYAVNFNHDAYLVSDACLVSTILSIIMIPILVMIVELVMQLNVF